FKVCSVKFKASLSMGQACCDSPREWVRGSVIGVGTFGTVSLAMDKATGELLAVKSIECCEDRERTLVAMENEINILRRLDSPWIVKFLGDTYSQDGGVCRKDLLMEYMAGGSVADVVQRFGGQLEESVIRSYARGILRGIEYLHSQGIVHGDIKGRNVLVGSSGVKLADFGSAIMMATAKEGERKVELSGTPLWMAPEVVNQEARGLPCDIWSMGCTVVEMATGRPPWTNIPHPLAAMYKIGCSDELPEFPKTLSPEGHDFLEKCFRRDPEQRWTSAQLLTHPFLSECIQKESESPTSTLNFHSTQDHCQWNESNTATTFSITSTSFSLNRNSPKPLQEEEAGHNNSKEKGMCEERPRPSPRQRMAELAKKSVSGSKISANRPDWCLSPSSNWIVVRSLSDNKLPMLDTPFSNFINESFAQSIPSIETSHADCYATSLGIELSKDESSLARKWEDFGATHDEGLLTSCTHAFCSSVTHETVFCRELAGPESSPDVLDIHEKKEVNNVSLSRLKNKLLKFLMNASGTVAAYSDTILQLVFEIRLGHNDARNRGCHLKPETAPLYLHQICYSRIRIGLDSARDG
ncbi:hypothetical protein KI387_037895, partial [Taxus chinensis]